MDVFLGYIQKFRGLLFPNLITCDGVATQRPFTYYGLVQFYFSLNFSSFSPWQLGSERVKQSHLSFLKYQDIKLTWIKAVL